VKIIAITFKAFLDTPVQWPIIFQSLGKSSMNILLIIIVNDDFRFLFGGFGFVILFL